MISKDNEAARRRLRRRIVPYVEEADDEANKVSQRPGAHPITGNYRLQGGNLQANWYNNQRRISYETHRPINVGTQID